MEWGDKTGWNSDAFKTLGKCDLVFFDPDNGLVERDGKDKSITTEEIRRLYNAGKSIIIYQHFYRKKAHDIADEKIELLKTMDKKVSVRALWYHRGTARMYVIVLNGEAASAIGERIDMFCKHFKEQPKKMRHFDEIIVN
jgi:hypothetical protein